MSWLYLPERGEGCLPVNGLNSGGQSAMWSETDMRSRCCEPGSEMAGLMTRPSGVTFAVSRSAIINVGDSSAAWGKFVTISLSREDSRVSRLARQGQGNRMRTCEMDGRIPFALLGRFDLNISGSKMCGASYQQWIRTQMSLFDILEPFCETWPKAGMMHDGACYRRPKWERRISEIGFGLWPTVSASSGSKEVVGSQRGRNIVAVAKQMWPTPYANKHTSNVADMADLVDADGQPWQPGRKPYDRRTGKQVTTTLHDFVRFWRTPSAGDGVRGHNSADSNGNLHLSAQVHQWPTPTVNGNHNRAGLSEKSGDGLATAVKQWPTPGVPNGGRKPDGSKLEKRGRTYYRQDGSKVQLNLEMAVSLLPTPQARDYRTGEAKRWHDSERSRNLNDAVAAGVSLLPPTVMDRKGDSVQLNPDWVELLMGWPMGWTALEPLTAAAFVAWLENPGWGMDWERGVPRTARGLKHRVSRLKVIGNGQVPLSAAGAWDLLEVDDEVQCDLCGSGMDI